MQKREGLAKKEGKVGTMKEKTIYILPGWTHNTSKWETLINLLTASGYKTHQLKIPGLEERIDTPWTISDYVNWLNGKIEGEKDVVLIGHSNGGRIALSYALEYPNKISDLILIDSAGFIKNDISNRIKKGIFKALAKTGKSLRLPAFTKTVLYKLAGEKDYYKASPFLRQTMQNLITLDLSEKVKDIEIPTTIIWGENDKITPLSFANILKINIINSKLFIIKNGRHSPQYTHPEKVFQIIVDNIS